MHSVCDASVATDSTELRFAPIPLALFRFAHMIRESARFHFDPTQDRTPSRLGKFEPSISTVCSMIGPHQN